VAQWAAFFALGTINNLSYVVVNSAAKNIADSFGQSDLIGVIVWANVGVGVGFKALNTWFLESVSYDWRILYNSVMLVAGLVCVALSAYINFGFAIFGIIMVGSASAFGESVILGFLKAFNPKLTGAWSSGTGMAGVGGTLMYIALNSLGGLSNRDVFLLNIPLAFVYWAAYKFVSTRSSSGRKALRSLKRKASPGLENVSENSRQPPSPEQNVPYVALHGESGEQSSGYHKLSANRSDSDDDMPTGGDDFGGSDEDSMSDSDVGAPAVAVVNAPELAGAAANSGPNFKESGLQRSLRVLKVVLSRAGQLAAVYFFEYVVSVGFAALANPKKHSDGTHIEGNWWYDHGYEVLSFCYQSCFALSFFGVHYHYQKSLDFDHSPGR